MLRFFAVSLCVFASVVSSHTAGAQGLMHSGQKPPFYNTVAPYPNSLLPVSAWPVMPLEPAIARTLRASPPAYPAPAPMPPAYEAAPPALAPQWEQPVYPGSRFSYPQQGFYPREGYQNQHPGYEYDFDNGPSYGSYYPIEGATHRTYRATGFSNAQTVPARSRFFGTGHPCGTY